MVINERARAILSQVITLHYSTCEPVGSATISKTRAIPCSPATIRNVMMNLESSGYLSQPHVSAGRLPTDLGYRAYVNDIQLRGKTLDAFEQTGLLSHIEHSPSSPAVLKNIANYIHRKTNLMTFYLAFRQCGIKLKHVHFESVSKQRILVLWISRGGHTFQTTLEVPEEKVSQALLEKVENYVNNAYRGFNLREIQRDLAQRNIRSNDQWDLLIDRVALIINILTDKVSRLDNIEFQGVTSLLEMPEFQNMARVKTVFKLLERQNKIENLIKRVLEKKQEWIMFFIGMEMEDPDMEGLTVVLAKIRNRDDELGCVGVLGPKRLPYLRSLQMLSFAKDMVALQPS